MRIRLKLSGIVAGRRRTSMDDLLICLKYNNLFDFAMITDNSFHCILRMRNPLQG